MNERNTEEIVREYFKKDSFFINIKIEEGKSAHSKIKNLLSKSSKNKTENHGYPDFIITIPSLSDLIIILECKANPVFHKDGKKNNIKNYAVDGVLHYAKNLSKEFDVIAIAVSGQDKKELKVSNFLIRKEKQLEEKLEEKLLSIYDYISIYKGEGEAKKIENLNITGTAIQLNEILHNHEISAHHRCTLIGGILLALEDEGFRVSYKSDSKSGDKPNPKKLTKRILDGIKNVLVEKKIDDKRSETIKKIYSVIETFHLLREEKITKGEDNYVIRDIIDLLERNIYPLTQNGEKGYDVLGRFYTEFVKYTSSDKKNGIVLTPQHITEFFCEIASLNVDSIILDPCCGTGGFLVSAMKYMLNQTNDNEIKNRIKEKQLIGIEKEAEMFCFACSNMIMSGDGKAHIYHGDCFSEKEKDIIKDLKPNIAFLNPPYKEGNAEKQL